MGLVKGLVLGLAIGAGVQLVLGWPVTPDLSGYLLAMGTGATAGVLAGRPPWRREAWLEGVLKAFVGLGLGLLVHWLGDTFAARSLPLALFGAPEGTPWTHVPMLYAPLVATLYGAMVELDNTPSDRPGSGSGTADAQAPTIPAQSSTWDA